MSQVYTATCRPQNSHQDPLIIFVGICRDKSGSAQKLLGGRPCRLATFAVILQERGVAQKAYRTSLHPQTQFTKQCEDYFFVGGGAGKTGLARHDVPLSSILGRSGWRRRRPGWTGPKLKHAGVWEYEVAL